MRTPDTLSMLQISIQQAFENIESKNWTKAEFIMWVEARVDSGYNAGYDRGYNIGYDTGYDGALGVGPESN